eukprot:COSAG01_NODE_510_length_16076_cov_102.088252_17_plen_160_part_00
MVGWAGGRAVRAAASKRVAWLARAPVRRQTGHGDAPTPIVGQKFRVKLDSQKRSISEVLPTVELPSSSTLRSFLVRSLPAEFIVAGVLSLPRHRNHQGRGGQHSDNAAHTRIEAVAAALQLVVLRYALLRVRRGVPAAEHSSGRVRCGVLAVGSYYPIW